MYLIAKISLAHLFFLSETFSYNITFHNLFVIFFMFFCIKIDNNDTL